LNRLIRHCKVSEMSQTKFHAQVSVVKGDTEYLGTGAQGMRSIHAFLMPRINMTTGDCTTYVFHSLKVYQLHLEATGLRGFGTPGFLKAIANLDEDEILRIFEEQDTEALMKLPGLGAKVGKDLIKHMFKVEPPTPPNKVEQSEEDKDLEDGITISLTTLGHKATPARKAAKKTMLAHPDVKNLDELVTLSLKK